MSILATCFVIGVLVYSISALGLYFIYRSEYLYKGISDEFYKRIKLDPNYDHNYEYNLNDTLKMIMLTPVLNTLSLLGVIIEVLVKLVVLIFKIILNLNK